VLKPLMSQTGKISMARTSRATDVVITGMGLTTPLGLNVPEFSANMFAGKSGIRSIRGVLVGDSFPIPYAGYIERTKLKELTSSATRLSDASRMALVATQEACAELPKGIQVDAIVYGSAEGIAFDTVQKAQQSGPDAETLKQTRAEAPLLAMSEWLRETKNIAIDERNLVCVNSACASGNQAIGDAMQRIRAGEWSCVVVGGVDSRCNAPNLMNFHMLGALCSEEIAPAKASRPFSLDRAGFIRSEGAATLILESRAHAEARGAKILGIALGYAMTSDAYRLTDGRDDGLCVQAAMTAAVKDADLSLEQIDAISAHGTSTPLNDRLETRAIKTVFGDMAAKIPVTSLKSQLGHTTVAAGAIEAVACLLMIARNTLAPTINYHHPDPECDLDYVPNHSRPVEKLDHILSNNFGFGGQNTCLVISRNPK
jgi:3-oxoacyl-[acyl-carrier-protein] synthase II